MTTVLHFPQRGIGKRGERALVRDIVRMKILERLSDWKLSEEALEHLPNDPIVLEMIRRLCPQMLENDTAKEVDMTKRNFTRLLRALLFLVPHQKRAWFSGWFVLTFRRFRNG